MKKLIAISLSLLLCLALLTGCGGSNYTSDTAMSEGAYDSTYAPQENAMAGGDGFASDAAQTDVSVTQPQDSRKIIRDATISMETLQYPDTVGAVKQAVASVGGYISASDSDSAIEGSRYISLTCRIPAEKYDTFMTALSGSGNITKMEESTDDVTANYVDVQSHIEALKKQEERLYTLMEEAGSLETLLTIQQQLTDVQYQIDSYESQLRTMGDLVAYSTVTVYVSEVRETTESVRDTFGSRVAAAFKGMWRGVVSCAQGIVISLIYLLPVLVIGGVVALIIVLCVRAGRKKHPRAARNEEFGTPTPQNVPAIETKQKEKK